MTNIYTTFNLKTAEYTSCLRAHGSFYMIDHMLGHVLNNFRKLKSYKVSFVITMDLNQKSVMRKTGKSIYKN